MLKAFATARTIRECEGRILRMQIDLLWTHVCTDVAGGVAGVTQAAFSVYAGSEEFGKVAHDSQKATNGAEVDTPLPIHHQLYCQAEREDNH